MLHNEKHLNKLFRKTFSKSTEMFLTLHSIEFNTHLVLKMLEYNTLIIIYIHVAAFFTGTGIDICKYK